VGSCAARRWSELPTLAQRPETWSASSEEALSLTKVEVHQAHGLDRPDCPASPDKTSVVD